jgi:hypothetical protein
VHRSHWTYRSLQPICGLEDRFFQSARPRLISLDLIYKVKIWTNTDTVTIYNGIVTFLRYLPFLESRNMLHQLLTSTCLRNVKVGDFDSTLG